MSTSKCLLNICMSSGIWVSNTQQKCINDTGTQQHWCKKLIRVKTVTKTEMCSLICDCLWQNCCKALRYPLLPSIAAMGLVVPRGHRWHQNPPSYSVKVTKKVQPPPTYSMLMTDSSGWFLPKLLVPHQSSESSTIIFFMKEWERKKEQKRKPFKMSNHSRTGSLKRIGKKENIVALHRTADLVRAPTLQCLMRQETRRKRCRCRVIDQKM